MESPHTWVKVCSRKGRRARIAHSRTQEDEATRVPQERAGKRNAAAARLTGAARSRWGRSKTSRGNERRDPKAEGSVQPSKNRLAGAIHRLGKSPRGKSTRFGFVPKSQPGSLGRGSQPGGLDNRAGEGRASGCFLAAPATGRAGRTSPRRNKLCGTPFSVLFFKNKANSPPTRDREKGRQREIGFVSPASQQTRFDVLQLSPTPHPDTSEKGKCAFRHAPPALSGTSRSSASSKPCPVFPFASSPHHIELVFIPVLVLFRMSPTSAPKDSGDSQDMTEVCTDQGDASHETHVSVGSYWAIEVQLPKHHQNTHPTLDAA